MVRQLTVVVLSLAACGGSTTPGSTERGTGGSHSTTPGQSGGTGSSSMTGSTLLGIAGAAAWAALDIAKVSSCRVTETRTYSLEDVPMASPTFLRLAGDGSFWITSLKPGVNSSQSSGYFGRLDATGLTIAHEFPNGTSPTCHAPTADGRHWLAGRVDVDTGYVAELDSDANLVKTSQLPGELHDCQPDPSGGVFLAGEGLWDHFDAEPHVIWARYDADHAFDWFQGVTGWNITRANALSLGRDGDLFSCSSYSNNLLVAKLNAEGTVLWSREFGTRGSNGCYAMALDASDNAWVSAFSLGALDLGGGFLPETDHGSDFRDQQVSKLYGSLPDTAAEDPLSPDYVPAPVLILNGLQWVEPSYRVTEHEVDDDCGQESNKPGDSGLQKALVRLGRDSQGIPWLVAAITTADTRIRTGKDYSGEFCNTFVATELENQRLELRLIRLAVPSVEHSIELGPLWQSDTRLVLDMEGVRGTLASITHNSATLWEIDLDAAGK